MTIRFGQRLFCRGENEPSVTRYLRASGDLQMEMFGSWPTFIDRVDADIVLVLPHVLARLSAIEETSRTISRKNSNIVRQRLFATLAREINYSINDILKIQDTVSSKDEPLIRALALRLGLASLLGDAACQLNVSGEWGNNITYFRPRKSA
jgi:hypothetical protein